MSDLPVFTIAILTLMGISFGVGALATKNCKSVDLPRYQAAFYEVGGKTCYFTLDNSDGSLHVALGPTGKHCS